MRRIEICALLYLHISFLVCVVKSQCNSNNDTIPEVCRQYFNNTAVKCTELDGECLNCTWPEDCEYGEMVNVTCESKFDDIECTTGQVRGYIGYHLLPKSNSKRLTHNY